MTDFRPTCRACGQILPDAGRLTPRELELLAAFWLTDSVKEAARMIGIGEQRAKNMLATARIRNHASSNHVLMLQNMTELRSAVAARLQHKDDGSAAA